MHVLKKIVLILGLVFFIGCEPPPIIEHFDKVENLHMESFEKHGRSDTPYYKINKWIDLNMGHDNIIQIVSIIEDDYNIKIKYTIAEGSKE